METEKEIEYKSTIMEMRNIIKNQERVIEELMLNTLKSKTKLNFFYKIFLQKRDHLRKCFLTIWAVRTYDEADKRFFYV